MSDPDRVVDIIISAKDAIGQADVSDEEIASALILQQAQQDLLFLSLKQILW